IHPFLINVFVENKHNEENYEDKSDKINIGIIKNKSIIEGIIKNSDINVYEYNDFYNFKKFGESKFNQILKADWKDNPAVVLKSLATNLESGEKQFIREVCDIMIIFDEEFKEFNDIGDEASTPPKQIEDLKTDNLILNQIEEKNRIYHIIYNEFKICNEARNYYTKIKHYFTESFTDKLIKLNEILGRYGHFCALRIAFGGSIIRIKYINKFSEQTKIIDGNTGRDTNSDLILEALGKRILKVKVDGITYVLGNQKKAHVHSLDCQIFTSLISQNDKYVFSTHIEYDEEYNPVVAIHNIKVQKKPIFGYPENFNFDQTQSIVMQSRKYPVTFSNNEYIVQLPCTTKYECIFGTCVLEPSSSHFDTFVIGVHLEASRNSACLFVYDGNKPRADKELLQSLKLFVCTISYKSSYQGEFLGQTAITWNNSQLKLSNVIDKINRKPNNFLTIIRKNIDTKKDNLFILPVFISQLYNINNCDKCHRIINITPKKPLRMLNKKSLKTNCISNL
ncbi:36187_t:CDS:10, partial [Gigaspora margarita]